MTGDPELQPAQTLGKYELLARLGRGRNCEVYLAVKKNAARQRIVAVKRLRRRSGDVSKANAALLREAELAERIKHPRVVDIYEHGEQDGICYIAMEYLAGQPLGALIRKVGSEIPLACVARIGADIADGLEAAHRLKGDDGKPLELVHLDVTPSNIQVLYDGRVLLVDFGLARSLATESATRGKIGYLAPEQLGPGQPDRRTDVFALGIVLWETATGKRLFRGADRDETLRLIAETDAPLVSAKRASAKRTGNESDFDAIIARALTRDPNKRYQTASELAKALRSHLATAGDVDTTATISELMLSNFADERATANQAIDNALAVIRGEKSGPRMSRALSEHNLKIDPAAVPLTATSDGDGDYYYYEDEENEAAALGSSENQPTQARSDSANKDQAQARRADDLDEESSDTGKSARPAAGAARAITDDEFAKRRGDDLDDLDDDLFAASPWPRRVLVFALVSALALVLFLVLRSPDKDTSASKEAEPSKAVETAGASSAATVAEGNGQNETVVEPPVADASVTTPEGSVGAQVEATAKAEATAAVEATAKAEAEALTDAAALAEAEAEALANAAALAEADARTKDAANNAANNDALAKEEARAKAARAQEQAAVAAEKEANDRERAKAAALAAAEDAKRQQRAEEEAEATPAPTRDKAGARRAYKRASRQLVTGDPNGAIRNYKDALRLWPGYAPAYRGLGLAHERRNNNRAAVRNYKRYLRSAPKAKDADSIRARVSRLGG